MVAVLKTCLIKIYFTDVSISTYLWWTVALGLNAMAYASVETQRDLDMASSSDSCGSMLYLKRVSKVTSALLKVWFVRVQ
jgi:hypothetical protein